MLFKHPEILFFLIFLLIPVLVHLFQLRKFRKEAFTNVAFLKKASINARRSNRIKKWLILCTRLLLLASIILAFAQPYFPASQKALRAQELVFYLDNSYSLQAKGPQGNLLQSSVRGMLEGLPEKGRFSLFLDDKEFRNITLEEIRPELQEISYSSDELEWKTVILKAQDFFSEDPDSRKNFVIISDFQLREDPLKIKDSGQMEVKLVHLRPENIQNIAIDTAFISKKTLDETILEIHFSRSGKTNEKFSVSVSNAEDLLGRKTVSFNDSLTAETSFKLPSSPIEKGKISIPDAGLDFDNDLYFSINKTEAIKVAVISGADPSFLNRIYREPEFSLRIFPPGEIDYNELSQADLIILNEPEEIPVSLSQILRESVSQNSLLVIIPSENAELGEYNSFFKNLGLPLFEQRQTQEKLITEISFSHPIFENVFDEKVENFDYPKVESFFKLDENVIPVLSFENKEAFLFQQDNVFVFTAPINPNNSDFQHSPLIVPTFYNLGNLALSAAPLYFYLGEKNKLDVKASLEKDEILKLISSEYSFIPLQQSFKDKVEVQLENIPEKPGHFKVATKDTILETLSFNINRKESRLQYQDLQALERVKVYQDIPKLFQELKSENEIHSLWKWFVIFALFFLLAEIFILKYFK